jgi:asparagine synthase (glutamine-hydrolysing)
MLYVDTKTWLPNDLLVKADKMTMANSLELRVPFLDHQILEFAAALPPAFKVKGRETKRILKQAFLGQVPRAIIDRRKVGFPVPLDQWLQGDLRNYVQDTLLSRKALSRGYFNRAQVAALVSASARGEPLSPQIFSLLALELWHQQFLDSNRSPATEPSLATA